MSSFIYESCLKLPKYWSPSVWAEHVPFAFWIVDALKPRVYVKLGMHYGMSYFAICQMVAEKQLGTHCFAIDNWIEDEQDGVSCEEIFRQVDEHNRLNYSGFSSLFRTRSDQALAHIPDGAVDLLQIDGRRHYDDVKETFESSIPKLSSRAVIMFHGTEMRERGWGIWKYWAELEGRLPSFNFLHGHGLGVIAFGPKIDPALTDFFAMSASPDATASFRHVFMSCEKNLSDQWEQRVQREADGQRLAALVGELETRQGEFEAVQSALSAVQRNWSELTDLVVDLQSQLAKARGKPLRVVGDYIKFRALKRILKLGLPLSAKRTVRLAYSAAKCNPNRSLTSTQQLPAQLSAPTVAQEPLRQLAEKTSTVQARPAEPLKKTIMVVSHDASRTGAPILALNLANEFSKKYNVVNLILGGGELRDSFLAAGMAMFEVNRRVMGATEIMAVVDDLCDQYEIAFALVNSVESRSVLPALKARNVPSVCLLHEFASNIRPITAFADVFKYADQVVFSTRLTLENALNQLRIERNGSVHLIPQGKCLVPARNENPAAANYERLWLEKILRPGGEENREFVVLGAGALEMRKGLDLFVECGNRVVNTDGGGRFQFVWIGNGYNPESDMAISGFLADQINRAGLDAQVKIIRATSEIEHAYANADLLLLPSRLDPLPNVAVDALIAGIPVVCFDRTTGIADFLIANGLGDACVAAYLDTTDLSRKVLALASNDEMRAHVIKRGQSAAVGAFDFPRYVERLDEIASRKLSLAEQADHDMKAILASQAFRADFYRSADWKFESEKELVARYLNSNRLGGVVRKPMPGFHPSVYAAHHDTQTGSDPLVRFLQEGKPPGPWSYRVVDNSRAVQNGVGPSLRTAIHLHVFYPEMLHDILSRLEANATAPDLFVSAPKSNVEPLQDAFSGYRGKVVDIRAVPNRGRDIAPLLTTFGRRLVAEYDVIGHFHTKTSPHVADRKIAETWSDFLLENLIGGQNGGPMLDRILAEMSSDPKIGITYPDDPHIMSWTQNRGAAENVALRMGLGLLPSQFNFPIGTMFWIHSSVLAHFVALDLAWEDYPAEPLPVDGTMLHALERLFGVVPELVGKATLVTNVRGVTR